MPGEASTTGGPLSPSAANGASTAANSASRAKSFNDRIPVQRPQRAKLPRAPGESNGKFFVKYEKLACPVRSANNRGFRLGGNRKVDWGWSVWGLDAAVHEALLFAGVGFLVGGLHDLAIERKSVVWGESVSVRVALGGRRIIKTKEK